MLKVYDDDVNDEMIMYIYLLEKFIWVLCLSKLMKSIFLII